YAHFSGAFEPLAKASWQERRRSSLRAAPSAILAVIIIGGIYGGVFTPTESAGVGFVLAVIITAAILRTLTWALFKEAALQAMKTTVTIFLIIAGAKIFAKAITLYRIPHEVSALILQNFSEPAMFILVVCVVLLILGLFLESVSMLLIVVPVLFPALAALGIDPIWFGIFFMLMIECALITPPVGLNLFVIQAVANAPLGEVVRGVWPFILLMFATVLAIYLFPDLVLYIPFKL
ncbi:MAG: TRAP transporter large permease subunit, partial [Rhodovibrionaceae bacterium]